MGVAVGSTEIDAQDMLVSLKGTLAEVRAELAAGAVAGVNFRCINVDKALKTLAGSGTTWAVFYKVAKP